MFEGVKQVSDMMRDTLKVVRIIEGNLGDSDLFPGREERLKVKRVDISLEDEKYPVATLEIYEGDLRILQIMIGLVTDPDSYDDKDGWIEEIRRMLKEKAEDSSF